MMIIRLITLSLWKNWRKGSLLHFLRLKKRLHCLKIKKTILAIGWNVSQALLYDAKQFYHKAIPKAKSNLRPTTIFKSFIPNCFFFQFCMMNAMPGNCILVKGP